MIRYDSKTWFSFLFSLQASYLRKLSWSLIAITAITTVICLLQYVYHVIEIKIPLTLHSLMGVVLGLLLVFRTNTAYERWWEGRKLLGALVNTSRNLSIKLNAFIEADVKKEREKLSMLICGFSTVLPLHLRDGSEPEMLAVLAFMGEQQLRELDRSAHKPNAIASILMREIQQLLVSGKITGEQFITLAQNANELIDELGGMERIKNTPIPLPYAMLLKRFIFIYVISLPFGLVNELGWASVVAVGIVFYLMVVIEIIAEEIENPFGTDENDLPVDEIAANIVRNVKEIFNIAHGESVEVLPEGTLLYNTIETKTSNAKISND
jgi:ion channel-forming bestrophin family protein